MEEENELTMDLRSYEEEPVIEYPINTEAITIEDCEDLLKYKSLGVLLNDGLVAGFEGGF